MARTVATVELKTIFTPPASCSNSFTYERSEYNGINPGIFLQNAFPEASNDCFPPSFANYGRVPSAVQVYSPGWCPAGYTTASIGIDASSVSSVTCCLSGYSFYSGYSKFPSDTAASEFRGCMAVTSGSVSSLGVTSYIASIVVGLLGQSTKTSTIITQALSPTQVSGTFLVWAQPVYVELQAKDTSLFSTTTTTTTTSSSTRASSTVLATSTPRSTEAIVSPTPTDSAPTGLSPGAKAGIGVGVTLGVIFMLALGIFLIMRRRRRKMNQTQSIPPVLDKHELGLERSSDRGELEDKNGEIPDPRHLPTEMLGSVPQINMEFGHPDLSLTSSGPQGSSPLPNRESFHSDPKHVSHELQGSPAPLNRITHSPTPAELE